MTEDNTDAGGRRTAAVANQLEQARFNRERASSPGTTPEAAADYKAGARNYAARARTANQPDGVEKLAATDAATRGDPTIWAADYWSRLARAGQARQRVARDVQHADRAETAAERWRAQARTDRVDAATSSPRRGRRV